MSDRAPIGMDNGFRAADPWVVHLVLAKWSPQAIATAAGVSVRTAYRWRQRFAELVNVEVGAWRATFAIGHGGPPMRLTPWTRLTG